MIRYTNNCKVVSLWLGLFRSNKYFKFFRLHWVFSKNNKSVWGKGKIIRESYFKFSFFFVFFVFTFHSSGFSQASIFNLPKYSFVNYDSDHIVFSPDSSNYDSLFAKMNTLVLKGQGQINIVHIGDSHIQADYFSGRLRERLQTFFLGGKGSRGFIFPFKLIHSNNAFNFSVNSTGTWVGCRNIEKNKSCTLGLAGASATTTDSISSFSIRLRKQNYPAYDFNIVKVFHCMDSTSFDIETDNYLLKQEFIENDSNGYTLFVMESFSDSLTFYISKTSKNQKSFTLYGINLENEDPGIIYHSIGVNGAEVESFLRCSLFADQLSKLKPDWVIVSLGTNDCYSGKFNMTSFESNLMKFIKVIRIAQPNVPILFTTPADHYRKRRYHNPNCAVASDVIIKVAKENNCASWNLYEIMGGYGSMRNWFKSGLAARDKLHFDKPGYYFQGDLLFNAFIKAYDNYIVKTSIF